MQRLASKHDHGHLHGSPTLGAHQSHSHTRGSSQQALLIALGVTAAFVVLEAVGAFITGSLALLADAGHMLTDVAAILLSLGAIWLARRPITPQRTFGFYRAEILAALVNAISLIAIALYVFYEALQRISA